jgi:hypothetical protein
LTDSLGGPSRPVVVRVAPLVRGVGKLLDYQAVGPALDQHGRPRVGDLVRVRLRGKRVSGVVVSVDPGDPYSGRLEKVERFVGTRVDPFAIELAESTSRFFGGSLGQFLALAKPPPSARAGEVPKVEARSFRVGEAARELDAGLVGPRHLMILTPPISVPHARVVAALWRACEGALQILVPRNSSLSRLAEDASSLGLPVGVLPQSWREALISPGIYLGLRGSVFAPPYRDTLAGAVVLEAESILHQEQAAPTWSAWRAASFKAELADAPCVLVSHCPHPVQLAAAGVSPGEVSLSPLDVRASWVSGPPEVRGPWSSEVVTELRRANAAEGRRVLVLVDKKSSSRPGWCMACGLVLSCRACGSRLASRREGGTFLCERCGAVTTSCPSCGAAKLSSRVRGLAAALRETRGLMGASQRLGTITGDLEDSDADVIVGTEAALSRGIKWEAVVIPYFSQIAGGTSPLACYRALALVYRAAAASGGGPVFVGTSPSDTIVEAAKSGRVEPVYRMAFEEMAVWGVRPCLFAFLVPSGPAEKLNEVVRRHPLVVQGSVRAEGPDRDGAFVVSADSETALAEFLGSEVRSHARVRVEDARGL